MLELKNIKKNYLSGENTVHALKGISLTFRSNEFVSILGPSGCGKTTMLNLIGGLDHYNEGDLIINGRSTKDYKDRDWDTYRNHSIGFVFQSYNLIPHQTVLQNVELALTLSGVSKSERKKRAAQALEEVGLGSQLAKKPSELSGGQMQRVAIARALVNNPDIILADEPTGALDTETSVQVMEILKKIAGDRLIIMVTHNPDLAKKYSSRIIRMLDGEILEDSRPLTEQEIQEETAHDKKELEKNERIKHPSMSFKTAFSLSLKNLFTKKGRTILTSFAGSIGIIGISLVLAISQGLTGYIDEVQENTLSAYPLMIESRSTDLTSLMEAFMNVHADKTDHKKDAVYQKSAMYDIINAMSNVEVNENDLKSFKAYIDNEKNKEGGRLKSALSGVQYSYDLDLQVYTKSVDETIIKSDTQQLMQDLVSEAMGMDVSAMRNTMENSASASMMGMNNMSISLWQELLPGKNGEPVNKLLKEQYDVISGEWPDNYDEIVLVVDKNNELNDVVLYALGLESKEEMDAIMEASMNGDSLEAKLSKWSYEDMCGLQFKVILNSDCYSYDEKSGIYVDLRETDAGLQLLYEQALNLKVSGIIRPKEDVDATMLTGSIGYTHNLTKYVIENSSKSDMIEKQKKELTKDILTGLPFKDEEGAVSDAEKQSALLKHIESLDEAGKAVMYTRIKSVISSEELSAMVEQQMLNLTRPDIEAMITQALVQQMGMNEADAASYVTSMGDEQLNEIFSTVLSEQIKMQYAEQVQTQLASMSVTQLAGALDAEISSYTAEQCALYYDNVMEFSESTYEDNLKNMGYIDLEDPSTINLYASSFENKDVIEEVIEDYNKDVEEMSKIQYTDYIGIIMSSVSTIINAITYILVAFVAISLIVSSIMIGVITLISVQERTKEIGILRAIGASKKNVSSMFNAETIIIGFTSGLLGVLVTYVLCIPINAIIHALTDINNLNAFLPVTAAIILILISMFLTLISGIIPSRSAAKKDPVVALRTE